MESQNPEPRLFAVLVTYRRQASLAEVLERLGRQSRCPDRLLVVDNESSAATERLVRDLAARSEGGIGLELDYLAADNLGPAGGWALGMEHFLAEAAPCDWILTLDDNNPPKLEHEIEGMFEFAVRSRQADPKVGAVGAVGARFDWKKGLIRRVATDELHGAVPVDYVGAGQLAMFSVEVIREIGSFSKELFFGYVELELATRMVRQGYSLLANGDLWHQRRISTGRDKKVFKPSLICEIDWKKYYRIRNYIYMMKRFGRIDLALRWAAIQCLAKPFVSLFRSPRLALAGFRQASRATRDGWFGRMGRTIDPPQVVDFIPKTFYTEHDEAVPNGS